MVIRVDESAHGCRYSQHRNRPEHKIAPAEVRKKQEIQWSNNQREEGHGQNKALGIRIEPTTGLNQRIARELAPFCSGSKKRGEWRRSRHVGEDIGPELTGPGPATERIFGWRESEHEYRSFPPPSGDQEGLILIGSDNCSTGYLKFGGEPGPGLVCLNAEVVG